MEELLELRDHLEHQRMEAITLKARIRPDTTLEWLEPFPNLPPGDIEVIVRYHYRQKQPQKVLMPDQWPVLHGGHYLGGSLRREEMYGDEGR
jgi:hypothetical protein